MTEDYTDEQIEEWDKEDMGNLPDGFFLSPEEIETLRQSKRELSQYGREKIRKLRMTEEYGHIPDGFYLSDKEVEELRKSKRELTEYGKEKLRKLMNHEEMLEVAERRERSNRVLERYNHYYNLECASLPHGTPITPEHQQIIAFESMIDALRCENLNHEFDVIPTADIEDLIEGLRNQANEFLKTVKEFKDSADGVA